MLIYKYQPGYFTGGAVDPCANWILYNGLWSDSGVWSDTCLWDDGPVTTTTTLPPTTTTTTQAPLLLDTYSGAKIAYSTRKLSNSYSGNCIRVRRASDNTEQDIGFVGNDLDSTSLSNFCSGTDGFVTIWYDQSGNAINATQSTTTRQPKIVSSGTIIEHNSKPFVDFSTGNAYTHLAINDLNSLTEGDMFAVLKSESNCNSVVTSTGWLSFGTFGQGGHYTWVDCKIYDSFGSTTRKDNITPGVTLSNVHIYNVLTKSNLWQAFHNNSSIFSTNTNVVGFQTTCYIGQPQSPNRYDFRGSFSEFILYSSDKSTDRNSIYVNISNHFSV